MYRTILVPLDGSTVSERALPIAMRLARATGAQLVLLEAAEAVGLDGQELDVQQRALTHQARAYLDSIAAELTVQGLQVSVATPALTPDEAILIEIDWSAVDLVVMSTHGRSGPGRWVFGSVAETVLTYSPVPVIIVPAQGALPTGTGHPRLVMPLDGSAFAERALPHAAALAHALNACLILVRVVLPPSRLSPERLTQPDLEARVASLEEREAHTYLADLAARLRAEGLTVETRVRSDNPARAIIQESNVEDASLVIMTTHGRTGLSQVRFGSVALDILHHGQRPVCLIRPEEMGVAREVDLTSEQM